MKKINFYLGALAIASTAIFSSCSSSNDETETPTPPTIDVVETIVPCEINATANVEDVTFTGPKTANKGETVTITATANTPGKYTSDKIEKTITIGEEHNLDVKFEFTLKPKAVDVAEAIGEEESITVFQGQAKEGEASETTTDESNAAKDVELVEDAKVSSIAMEIPKEAIADAKETAGSTEFSVVVVPANDGIEQVPASELEKEAEKPAEVSTLQAVCEPSGAVFAKPVTITIGAPESEGLEFDAVNGDEKIAGKSGASSLSISVPHFSAWDYVLKANVVNVNEKQTSETKTMIVSAGDNTINYTAKLGWTVDRKNVLVNAFLVGKLGSSKQVTVNKSTNFKSSGEGKLTYRIISKTIEFDVKSGSATFHVSANNGASIEIVSVESINKGHSGGSAN